MPHKTNPLAQLYIFIYSYARTGGGGSEARHGLQHDLLQGGTLHLRGGVRGQSRVRPGGEEVEGHACLIGNVDL